LHIPCKLDLLIHIAAVYLDVKVRIIYASVFFVLSAGDNREIASIAPNSEKKMNENLRASLGTRDFWKSGSFAGFSGGEFHGEKWADFSWSERFLPGGMRDFPQDFRAQPCIPTVLYIATLPSNHAVMRHPRCYMHRFRLHVAISAATAMLAIHENAA
jgi:hypothetical protein